MGLHNVEKRPLATHNVEKRQSSSIRSFQLSMMMISMIAVAKWTFSDIIGIDFR